MHSKTQMRLDFSAQGQSITAVAEENLWPTSMQDVLVTSYRRHWQNTEKNTEKRDFFIGREIIQVRKTVFFHTGSLKIITPIPWGKSCVCRDVSLPQ